MNPQEKASKQWIDREISIIKDDAHNACRLLTERLEQLEKDIYFVKVIVAGNGDPSKSVVVRLDRMEQAHERSAWFVKTALGTSVTSVVGVAAFLIKHFFFP